MVYLLKVLFEKIINFFDYFHQNRIINYLKQFKIKHFIDVGSHKGEFLSYLLKLKHKKIYCFEAQKDIFKILSQKYKKNKRIKLFNIGLADKKTTKIFYINKISSSSTFSKSKDTFFSRFKKFVLNSDNFYEKKYQIKTKRLDSYFTNKKIDNIFLKIDVEGFELNVLLGLEDDIKKVKFILFEHHYDNMIIKKYNFNDIHRLLDNSGFKQIFKIKMPFRKSFDYIYENKNL